MKPIPETSEALVLRTDFTDDAGWASLCVAIQSPQTDDDFVACVECVSDPAFSGVTAEQLVALNSGHTFIFIVDSMAIADSDHPVLVVDLHDNPGRTFRVVLPKCGELRTIFPLQIWTSMISLTTQMYVESFVGSPRSARYHLGFGVSEATSLISNSYSRRAA